MMRGTLLAVILLLPSLTFGATLEGQRNVVLSEVPLGNTYLVGADVRVAVPVPADITAAGGNITITSPVAGDVLLIGGTLDVEEPVLGDVRAAGGRVIIDSNVEGDVAVLGGVVLVTGKATDIQIMGGSVRITGGSGGNVTVYGSDVFISGEYMGNVEVSASDRVTVADGSHIHGTLRYNAPQEASIGASAVVDGGIAYTGAASYLPSPEEAKRYALAGAGVFFLVKALAALVVAGLVVGLFPKLSERIIAQSFVRSPRHVGLLALLGFAILALTPLLLIFLMISFVGIGVALILGTAYLLLLMLAYVYAGLLAGTAVLYVLTKKTQTSWKAAILGMFVLYLVSLVPVAGGLLVFACMLITTGTLARTTYEFAWKPRP